MFVFVDAKVCNIYILTKHFCRFFLLKVCKKCVKLHFSVAKTATIIADGGGHTINNPINFNTMRRKRLGHCIPAPASHNHETKLNTPFVID